MGRVYTVAVPNVSVSAVQDFFELTPADDKPIKLLQVLATVRDSETNEQLTCSVHRFSGAFTSGSGGTVPAPETVAANDTAAGFAVEANNTVRATGGTDDLLWTEGWPSQGGWQFAPPIGQEPMAVQGQALVIGLDVAPGSAVTMNLVAVVEEVA